MAKKGPRKRHQPQRTCISCRQTGDKRELVRVVRQADGQVLVDPRGKLSGRGAYLCMKRACWDLALEKRRIGSALKITLSAEQRAALVAYAETLPVAGPERASE